MVNKEIVWAVIWLFASVGLPGVLRASSQEEGIDFQYVDPLVKVFRNATAFPEQAAHADAARGQHTTFQFVVRADRPLTDLRVTVGPLHSDAGDLDGAKVGYVGFVHMAASVPNPAHDKLKSESGIYPDPILEEPPTTLEADTTQPIWITLPIPLDAIPGVYEGTVTLTAHAGTEPIRLEQPVAVHVYPPVIKNTRLWVTNWWCGTPGRRPDALRYMNDGKPVELFSDRYWELVRSLARTMADYRQNVTFVSPLHLARYELKDGRYSFDFSQFDRTVQIFIEEGVVGRIEGAHLGDRAADEWDPDSEFRVYMPIVGERPTTFEKRPITDEAARSFYRQFLPALVNHLKEKGWNDIYIQHIVDEPTQANVDSYLAIARFMKDLAPDLRHIDAALYSELDGLLDTWVPTLDGFAQNYDFYKQRLDAGDEVWFYTCVVPQGEYANRFIELPLIKTRLLHWINFRYGATGYLHWGFNFWDGDPFKEASERGLPGGDPWIVYPKKGGVLPSIRLEAMRDGIEDYELLKMLEDRHPEQARKLVRQIVLDFDKYDTDIAHFRQTRRALLEALSEPTTKP